jgi:hypothetical protein
MVCILVAYMNWKHMLTGTVSSVVLCAAAHVWWRELVGGGGEDLDGAGIVCTGAFVWKVFIVPGA